MLKTNFKEMDLGAIRSTIAPFALSTEVEQRLKDVLNINIVTLGQGGGRKGAELARFGWDIWMVNSATVDMQEHDWIERKIILTDPERGKLEGTAKNAAIGHSIAQKNINAFKKIAIETQDSDLLILTVALGGGQGNGAIPTAAEWITKVREMAGKITEKGNSSVMVVASLPARDESNPDIWQNALSGLKYLQDLISEKKIGSVILIDNELIRNYYEKQEPLTYHNRSFSALDYSNIMLARTFFEIMVLPLLSGQVSMDSAELIEILTTPGWLTINKREFTYDNEINLEYEIDSLFKNNEVFASLDVGNTLAGGIALITSKHKSLPPSIVDQVKPITNKILGKPSILHSAVIQTNSLTAKSFLMGLAVTPKLPDSILETLMSKYTEEKRRKEEKELATRQVSAALEGFDSVFAKTTTTVAAKKKVTLDDLMDQGNNTTEKKRVTLEDI
ncbi:hypothetical protein [Paenibacillus sp. GP183]|uniref:hypothetical protein n=1 Tax=Paenibacillus sp. GP183 TaxID=1882751 RepID=UPI00089C5535|nr:hypothetical protein [Paenibacillus sp. GP183]SED12499.1 hypothetical protein SAMN05443246_5816 [Paenibacillus sp. GP183]